jgi:hypothetical protein
MTVSAVQTNPLAKAKTAKSDLSVYANYSGIDFENSTKRKEPSS